MAKADCLLRFCHIEQALIVFMHAVKENPGSKQLEDKIKECHKMIFKKLRYEVFKFSGSKKFFDFLRSGKTGCVENYLEKGNCRLACIKKNKLSIVVPLCNKKCF